MESITDFFITFNDNLILKLTDDDEFGLIIDIGMLYLFGFIWILRKMARMSVEIELLHDCIEDVKKFLIMGRRCKDWYVWIKSDDQNVVNAFLKKIRDKQAFFKKVAADD